MPCVDPESMLENIESQGEYDGLGSIKTVSFLGFFHLITGLVFAL